MTKLGLVVPIISPPRAGLGALAIAGTLVAAHALREPPARVMVPLIAPMPVVVASPTPVVLPIVVPYAIGPVVPPARCTVPQHADRAIGRRVEVRTRYGSDHSDLRGVAASASLPVLAVWTDDQVLISRDDGETWQAALADPASVLSVVVDCAGNVIVARGARVGIADEHGERWLDLQPCDEAPELHVAGRWLLLRRCSQTRVTADLGATWRTIDEIDARLLTGDDLIGSVDGDFRSMGTYSDRCGVYEIITHHLEAPTGEYDYSGDPDSPDLTDVLAAPDGWRYGTARCGHHSCLMAWSDEPYADRSSTGLHVDDGIASPVITNGRTAMIATDDSDAYKLVQLQRDRVTTIARNLPVVPDTLDALDRPLARVDGALVRWSPRHGWRLLHR